VLESNLPAVNTDTHDQAERGPRRNDAARADKPIASNASPRLEPTPPGAAVPGVNTINHRVKCARIASAQRPKRRHQSRTVSHGTPRRSASFTRATSERTDNTAPITSTESRRRNKQTSGSNTCVDRHPLHLARRGRNRRPSRNTRQRANHHGPNTSPQPGQQNRPAARSASTPTGSFLTMSTMPPWHQPEGPSRFSGKVGGRALTRSRTSPP
jgi:hypothetical protein